MTKDYYLLTDSDNFDVIRHNERDFSSFRKFQDDLDEKFESIERERAKKEILSNMKKWDEQLPHRWSGADLKKIDHSAAKEAEGLIEKMGFGSFFIKGKPGIGKTYLSFAIIRRYISLGWVTPSQVKIISEESLLMIPKLGFRGHEKFDQLLSPAYKIYLFDNIGVRKIYDNKENPLWEQLIDHIYSNNLAAILTSKGSASNFAEKLSSSSESKLQHLLHKRIIEMTGTGNGLTLDDPTGDEQLHDEGDLKEMGLFKEF